jgi:transcriptional regulator with XRE-family HTH domain
MTAPRITQQRIGETAGQDADRPHPADTDHPGSLSHSTGRNFCRWPPLSCGSGEGKMTETWPEYLRRITAGETQSQIAQRTGIGRLSVCHWLHGKTRPKPETVIAVARVYDRSPIEALLAAGYLNHTEVRLPIEHRSSPRDLPAEELAAEVRRRLIELEAQNSPE